jgi:hypothetical protein
MARKYSRAAQRNSLSFRANCILYRHLMSLGVLKDGNLLVIYRRP